MIDFDYNRSARILSNILTKFFYLAVDSCRTLNLPNKFIEPILDQVCEALNDELFVMDANEHEYFTVDIIVDGEELSGRLILDKYDSIADNKRPTIAIGLVKENTPDTKDDLRLIYAIATHLTKTECMELFSRGVHMKYIPSICISAGYIVKVCSIMTDIATDFIMDTFLVRSSVPEDFKNPTIKRIQVGTFVNTLLRELTMCIVHHIGGNDERGLIVHVCSTVGCDSDDPNDTTKYETVIKPSYTSFKFIDIKELQSILYK